MTDQNPGSPEQQRALACVLDEIIPPNPDGRLPGAGAIGLGDTLAARPELWPLIEAGIQAIDAIAQQRGATTFAELPRADRRGVLDESVATAPVFLPTLIAQTFVGYYQDAAVREALGLDAGAPFPKGYAVAPTDFSILDPVRRRGAFFREP